MILTFAKLQRLSGLQKPTAIKAWLKREGVSFLRDADGRPFTTLDALNRKLHRAGDDGFILNDPERGLPEKRAMVQGRPQQVDRADQGGRRGYSPPHSAARVASDNYTKDRHRAFERLFATGGDSGGNAP